MHNTEISKTTNQNSISSYLQNPKFKEQLKSVLPKYLTADRMTRIALTELRSVPKLAECNPLSFMGAIIRCAQMGLEPSSERGHVHLIPFFNSKSRETECKIMLGYRGMLYLAAKAHILMETGVVFANDKFEFERGLEPKLKHVPSLNSKSDMLGVYAIARFQDNSMPAMFEYMPKTAVDEIMTRSIGGKSSSPWISDYEAMARKTVIRRLFKYLPMSDEIEYAVSADDQADSGTQNNSKLVEESFLTPDAEETKESRSSSLADRLQAAEPVTVGEE